MYFQSIEIENVGPIDHIEINFPFNDGKPKPIVIVGENGTGKSILLSHLVNSLIVGKSIHFDDNDIDDNKVYKYRSPRYIKSGKAYSSSSVKFTSGIEVKEFQCNSPRNKFEEIYGYAPLNPIWRQIEPNDSSTFISTFAHNPSLSESFYKNSCCLYFPVNRFEEPGWLNQENIKTKANYSDLKHISRYSNRSIINISPLKKNQDWILDILFDRNTFEGVFATAPALYSNIPNSTSSMKIFAGYKGQASKIYTGIIDVIKVILRSSDNVRLGAGTRKTRQISVMKNEEVWIPNLFQLSSGETQLLNLFLSIIRDFDLSHGNIDNLEDINGIVIIDEIDANLHTSHQREILPKLISSFPNVQFIITTHSPLFLIGMDEIIGPDNFEIINMPEGKRLLANDFSEFKAAYDAFSETIKHREEMQKELEKLLLPILFVEGDYDIRYLKKAAALLGRSNILDRLHIKFGDGSGNLDKIWKGYDNPMAEALPRKLILLYDCDTKRPDTSRGLVHRRTMPHQSRNPIEVGIENIFPIETIERVELDNPQFIDTISKSTIRLRGNEIVKPEVKTVNKDEKGNLCDWLCENGTKDDFNGFSGVFDIIECVLNQS